MLPLLATLLLPAGPRFEDATVESGLEGLPARHLALADYDRDGDPDLLVDGRRLYRNDSDEQQVRFTNVTFDVGLGFLDERQGGWLDFDRDGRLDLVRPDYQLLQGRRDGTFADRREWFQAEGEPGRYAVALDWDRDGLDDVAVLGAAGGLFRNRGRRLRPARDPLAAELRDAQRLALCDFDADGDRDCYVVTPRGWPDVLLRADGRHWTALPRDGGETRAARSSGRPLMPGATWLDSDQDGFLDLVVRGVLLRNRRGAELRDQELELRRRRGKAWEEAPALSPWTHLLAADLGNQGRPDWLTWQPGVSAAPCCWRAGGPFERRAGETLAAEFSQVDTARCTDLDGDGRLDLVLSAARRPGEAPALQVLRNVSATTPWIGFVLRAERRALLDGAQVLLLHRDSVQVRQVTADLPRVHFGLGDRGAVQEAFVTWAGGQVQRLTQLAPGRYHPVPAGDERGVELQHLEVSGGEAGEPTTLRVRRSAAGPCLFAFDLSGDRRPEAITSRPVLRHSFPRPGTYQVRVRGLEEKTGCGTEIAAQVTIR